MASNYQKTPLARSLEAFADRKVEAFLGQEGQALPASVVSVQSSGIVIIKFELTNVPFTLPRIKVPVIGAEYIRLPIQPGMKGMVISADAYLGGMSGLGGGTADLAQRPNLANLAFVPLGSSAWSETEDANATIVYGPNGVVIRDTGKNCTITVGTTQITLNGKNEVLVEVGSTKMTMTSAGTVFDGPVTFNQDIVISGDLHVAGSTFLQALQATTALFTGAIAALSAAITNALTGGTVASTAGDITAQGVLRGADMQVLGHVAYSLHEHGYLVPTSSTGQGLTGTPS